MREYNGKINVFKDDMLFIVNTIFKKGIKENTTKESILKLIPDLYIGENLKELIKILPYESYKTLEKLVEFSEKSDDINEFAKQVEYKEIHYLEKIMIIIMRAKYSDYNYSLNPGVIKNLAPMFSEENRKIAKKYGEIEKLTMGMLYTYGVVEFNYFRTTLCKYMNRLISEEELYDIYFKRLNLNLFVNYCDINWTNVNQLQSFVTYLDEEEIDISDIAAEQKSRGLQYKSFSKENILKRDEYLWDEMTQKLYKFIESKDNRIWEYKFKRIIKKSELGENILNELINIGIYQDESETQNFLDLFMQWYNNSPLYILGGCSPSELFKKYYK